MQELGFGIPHPLAKDEVALLFNLLNFFRSTRGMMKFVSIRRGPQAVSRHAASSARRLRRLRSYR